MEPRPRRRTYVVGVFAVVGLIALFEALVGFLGSGLEGLRLAALIGFGVVVLGYGAHRRAART